MKHPLRYIQRQPSKGQALFVAQTNSQQFGNTWMAWQNHADYYVADLYSYPEENRENHQIIGTFHGKTL